VKHCVVICVAALWATVWTASAYAATTVKQNGYVYASMTDGTITSLKFDGRGLYNYGMNTVAGGGGIRGCSSMTLSGRVLTILPAPGAYIEWDLPFVRAGYYDADTHLNYPNDRNTLGATPLVLPFRCFVASSGHYLRIEHFKRIAPGYYFDSSKNINLRNGSRLLMQGDVTQNWDIETTWQSSQTLLYEVLEDRLVLKAQASGPLSIEVLQRGSREAPANAFLLPRVTFVPDSSVTFEPTQKTVSISELTTELLRVGTYWYHNVPPAGEWAVCADMHLIDDPRTWYAKEMPAKLRRDQASIGYDRFGHFGHAYVWDSLPDYGAGGFLNYNPGHAPYELRMLHNNGIRVLAIVNYVLATGDTDYLRSRRTRVVKTNGAQTQPICGSGADVLDYVLSAGDMRYDGTPAGTQSSLGQEFTATASFSSVAAYLGNPSTDESNSGKIALYDRFGGAQLAQRTFSLPANTSQDVWLSIGQTLPPGKYYLEVTDNYSGTRYFGPHVAWWTKPDGNYTGGNAYNCGYSGDIEADVNLLFDYMRNYMGAAGENIAYYQNDPNFTTNYRSGRNSVGTTTSYWEGAGGGYDAYVALFYVDACSAMASLYDYLGDGTKAAQYRQMRALAEEKYRSIFWHTVVENGKTFARFHGCKDWDGAIHDFGFTMYNLEAAARDIASPEQSRSIFWWLDRGQYSPDGGLTWRDGIYSIWEAVPPFNTVENYSRAPTHTWLNLTGSLPWLNVLTNGGARLDTAARDLVARAKYMSAENMHERNEQVLARFASPDRLMGGRTCSNVPGGVPTGRWFFLGPDVDLGDFEGFREIFPQDGLLATAQPISYLGMCYTGWGLKLRPRVPSEYESVRFSNIGHGGAMFDFKAEAQRESMLEISGDQKYTVPSNAQVGQTFVPTARFSKVALRVSISPFTAKRDNRLTITLYSRASGGTWAKKAENWYSHAKDGQWVWVSTDDPLPPGVEYLAAVSAVRPAAGETIKLYHSPSNVYANGCAMLNGSQIAGDFALRAVYEKTKLTVESVYDPRGQSFLLRGPRAGTTVTNLGGGLRRLETVLEPDESALLTLRSSRTYHVKPDGDDSADGLSLETAWRSIANGDQKGILAPGDVVLVEPGTYPAVTISKCCGMQGLPITYRANGPVKLLCAVGPALTIDSGASWTSVEGFEITGQTQPAGHALLVRAQTGVTLAGLYIHDTTDYDYSVKLDGVRGAVVRNCITRGKPGQWNWLIYNCTDTKIVNNVFDGGYVQLFSWNGGSSGPGSTGTLVCNNIFQGAGNAILNWDDLSDLVHGYNCFWNNVNNYPQTTVAGPGEITANPRFPVGTPPDYHLVPGSPAIDAGTDVGLAYVGSRPDMGAIEADYADLTALADVWGSGPGTWIHVTDPKAVTAGSTTFIDGSYYVEEPSRTRGIKMMPRASGLPSVGPGSRITFLGVVRVDSNGEKYVDVYDVTSSAGAALDPVGVGNRVFADSAGTTGLLVRTWGLVTKVTSDYVYADDGAGFNDGSGIGTGIRIVLSGLTNPITKTFVEGVTYVKGVTGLVGRDTGGVVCLRPRSDADIQL
jgi:hypothetical protein